MSSKVHNSPPEGGSLELILDRTIFYPEGGGQPCDLGFVSGLPLLAVEEGPEGLIHILPDATTERQALFHPGACVELKLDARRRRDHTQQHSGQHLVSAVLERELGIHTLSFHLGESYSTIDITATSLDRSRIEAIETRVEEFVIANTPYRVHVCDSTRAREFPLRKLPPEGEEELRIIEIDGYDWVACCGTHVQKAGELRLVKILSAERYKGGTRLYFVAGDRAASLLFRQRDILARTALLLGCAAEEVEKRVEAHIETRKLQEQRMRALISRTAELEVDVAASSAGTTGLLGFDLEDRTAEEAMETIKAASRRGFAVLVLSRKDSTVCAQIPPS
ncbi:MAG TPA: alanyl-tRNA editing protein, partial [Rectinemataceae bacterium]